jgi:hypothetical protein
MEVVKSKKLKETDSFIPNFGYVPFKYFQYVYIIFILLSFIYKDFLYENVYKKIYDKIDLHIENNNVRAFIKSFIALLPILPLIYYDFFYKSFSMYNLGIKSVKNNRYINTMLRIFGSYVIIQVAAQDLGVKTGTVQSDFIKLSFIQVVLYIGCAFAITQDRSEAFLAALVYFQLKYFGSDITKDVCFD